MNSITKEKSGQVHTELAADNANYIEALYEQYLTDPDSVDTDWQTYLNSISRRTMLSTMLSKISSYYLLVIKRQIRVAVLIPTLAALSTVILSRWAYSN